MSIEYAIRTLPTHVVVQVSGTPTVAEFLTAVEALHVASRNWHSARLLLDVRQVTQTPDAPGQAIVGDHIGSLLVHVKRIASLVPEGLKTGVSEQTAQRLGANLRVFTQEDEATGWLLAERP